MKIIYHPMMAEEYDRTPAGALGRLESSVNILSGSPDYEFVTARSAIEDEILLAHSPEQIRKVRGDPDSTRGNVLYQVAILAAGGAIQAAEIALLGEPAFALIRPPGHHASRSSYWGFCYFNNLAISLLYLRSKGLINSAYVLDFDLHTGDGNINILGDIPGIIVHNPSGRGDSEYLRDVKQGLDSSPSVDVIVASAGFDQYELDWGANLSTTAFRKIGQIMSDYALENCRGRRYGLLEGGYNYGDLGKNVYAFCEGLRTGH